MAERAPNTGVPSQPLSPVGRRPFLVRFAALVIGAVVGVVPLTAGLLTFLDPLRRQGAKARWFRVGSVDSLGPGEPERVTIVGDRRDSWTDYRQEPIGAIYLVADAGRKNREGLQRHLPACRLFGRVSDRRDSAFCAPATPARSI